MNEEVRAINNWRVLWSADAETYLRDLVRDGILSYASVTLAINEKFGTAFSRSAVIGKAHRCGLFNALSPDTGRKQRKPEPVPRPRARNCTPRVATIVSPRFAPAPLPPLSAIADLDPTLRRPLLELERHQCRWPVDHMFCGSPVAVGYKQPYCPAHQRLNRRLP